MGLIKRIWSAAPIATVILVLALAAGLFFAVRMVAIGVYWNEPARHEQAIQPWMTPRFVSHSWKVPRRVVIDVLESRGHGKIPETRGKGPFNLRQIAAANGISVEDLITELQIAIARHRAETEPETRP